MLQEYSMVNGHKIPVRFAVKGAIEVENKKLDFQSRPRVVHSKQRIPTLVAALGAEMFQAQFNMLATHAVNGGNGARIINPLLLLEDANQLPLEEPSIEEKEALQKTMTKTYIRPSNHTDYEGVLRQNTTKITEILRRFISSHLGLKFSLTLTLNMRRAVQLEESATFFTHTKTRIVFQMDDIEKIVGEQVAELLENIDNMEREGSGWIVNNIDVIEISKAR